MFRPSGNPTFLDGTGQEIHPHYIHQNYSTTISHHQPDSGLGFQGPCHLIDTQYNQNTSLDLSVLNFSGSIVEFLTFLPFHNQMFLCPPQSAGVMIAVQTGVFTGFPPVNTARSVGARKCCYWESNQYNSTITQKNFAHFTVNQCQCRKPVLYVTLIQESRVCDLKLLFLKVFSYPNHILSLNVTIPQLSCSVMIFSIHLLWI